MKALTLWRPWPVATFYFSPEYWKNIENLFKKPPQSVIGQRIAIHAGKHLEPGVFERWLKLMEPNPVATMVLLAWWNDLSKIEGIVGTVVIDSVCGPDETNSRWASGPVCLRLRDRMVLREPIPFKGKQGYWNVPPETEAKIKRLEICEVSIDK